MSLHLRTVLLALVLIDSISWCQTIDSFASPSVKAGDPATGTGKGLDAVTRVDLKKTSKPSLQAEAEIKTKAPTSLTFMVPSITPGTYTVTLTPGGDVSTTLTVTDGAPASPVPAVTTPLPSIAVFPTTTYPVLSKKFNFEINGSNFGSDENAVDVEVEGQGFVDFSKKFKTSDDPEQQCTKDNPQSRPCLGVSSVGRRLTVVFFPRRHAYQGPMKVRVFVNKVPVSDWSPSFTLSSVDHRIVVGLTFVFFFLLMYTVYRLVARGIQEYQIAGQKYSPLAAFLIDKDTNSYSLSKFQLLAFSLVSFFGYIYVFLCKALVQWNFTFPDIPDNYPSLLAISAGTTATAAGLNISRGGKGAGPVLPSAADLISNGGMVVAERFQFFVWTLVACLGFIALILMQDPAIVSSFPTFPSGLLYVMGVSAVGYLGGKAVRNPGPKLKEVKVKPATAVSSPPGSPPNISDGNLVVTLLGDYLDKKAKFRIDGVAQTPVGLVAGTPQPGAPQDYCSQLDFELVRAAGFTTGDHMFEIINNDGLGAQAQFTGTPMEITKPRSLSAGTTPVPVVLTVKHFRENCTARWQPPGAASPQELGPVKFTSPDQVEVTLVPGQKPGTGTLTLVTPRGNTETTSIEIV